MFVPAHWTPRLVLAVAIWAAGTVAGVSAIESLPNRDNPISVVPAPGGEPPRAHSTRSLYARILGRNLAVYLWLLSGLVTGGLTTVAVLLFNGALFGATTSGAAAVGMAPERIVWLLIPHGVPEIGTFLVAGAIGLQGPRLLADCMNGQRVGSRLSGVAYPATLGALVLVGAAAIEVGVTVPLADRMTGP